MRFWGPNHKKAFTAVEMMFAVGVVIVLSAILIPNVLRSFKTSRYAKAKKLIKDVSDAAEIYQAVTGRFPSTITSLTGATPPYITPSVASRYCNDSVSISKVVDGYGHVCLFNITAAGTDYAYYVYGDETDGTGFYLVGLIQSGASRGKYLFNETTP